MLPRLIAFYLPQFHSIPENDIWWGPGFTEWQGATAARPLFRGHYQPHLPAELGCYDLRDSDVRYAQAMLAASHGIDAFCYYHYWFHGKRLLETPFQAVLDSGTPAFPFCLCWANEPWTRRYDGRSRRRVLMPQTYSEVDDLEHIRWLSRAFLDRRYLRIDGKALFLIYRAARLPCASRTIGTWREEAAKLGVGELFICSVESNFRGERGQDPGRWGADATVEFQPDIYACNLLSSFSAALKEFGPLKVARCALRRSQLRSYTQLAKTAMAKKTTSYRRFPCVTPSWDNTSRRRRGGALIYHGSTPAIYGAWLRAACKREVNRGGNGLVFINAWNEWAEGCHLEPDQRHGRAYLEATLRGKEQADCQPEDWASGSCGKAIARKS
jgi:hypothetical protein